MKWIIALSSLFFYCFLPAMKTTPTDHSTYISTVLSTLLATVDRLETEVNKGELWQTLLVGQGQLQTFKDLALLPESQINKAQEMIDSIENGYKNYLKKQKDAIIHSLLRL